ncbi:MAG: hypothetical protein ABIO70_23240 [Pseudomonadota bacterium]
MASETPSASDDPLVRHVTRELVGPPPLSPKLASRVLAETRAWCRDWLHERLPGLDARTSADINAGSFRVWHEPAPGRGLASLNNFAARQVRGDVTRAADLAQEAWTSVFQMLGEVLERTEQGRSLADFRLPAGRPNASNVASYLRKRVVWIRNAQHRSDARMVSLEEPEMEHREPAVTPDTDETVGSSWSVALRFACLWFVVDSTQERGRWWAMALHALGIRAEGFDPRGSRANEPARAKGKLGVRVRACLGLGPWLRRWAAFQPSGYWDTATPAMPDALTDDLPLDAVRDALERVQPALAAAVGVLPDLDDGQRRALVNVLVKNRHVESQLAAFVGDNTEERTQALLAAAERAGRGAVDVLEGRTPGSGGGWGPPCQHERERTLLAALAHGAVPTPAALQQQQALLARCEPCRDWWQGTCEAVEWLPEAAERGVRLVPEPRRAAMGVRGWAWVPIAAAAGALLFFGRPADPVWHPKGEQGVVPVSLELAALPPGVDAVPTLAGDGSTWDPGTLLTFRIDAVAPGLLYLLHRHPDGRVERLLPVQGDAPREVPDTPWEILDPHGDHVSLVLPEEAGRHQVVALVLPVGSASLAAASRDIPQGDPRVDSSPWQEWLERAGLKQAQIASFEVEVASGD